MIKTFSKYVEETNSTAIYPPGKEGLYYVALGAVGEAGEINNKLKKMIRGDVKFGVKIPDDMEDGVIKDKLQIDVDKYNEFVNKVGFELGDLCWYLAQASVVTNTKITKCVVTNIVGNYVGEVMGHQKPEITLIELANISLQLNNWVLNLAGVMLGASNIKDITKALHNSWAFVAAIMYYLGLDLESYLNYNIEKLTRRKEENKIMGDGDER